MDVSKVWDDADDADGTRPASVTVRLFADGVDTGRTVALDEAGDWTARFSRLDRYAHGKEIAYTVVEDPVEGYTTSVTGDASGGFVITNAHELVNPEPSPMHVIVYDLNGGNYDGRTDAVVESHAHGAVITIRERPVREGYTFLYWKGSEHHLGDAYTVLEDHTFVAQWEK